MLSYKIAGMIDHLFFQLKTEHPVQEERRCYYPNVFNQDPSIALMVTVRVDCDNHGYEKDGTTHHPEWERHYFRCAHFLLNSRHALFCLITDNSFESPFNEKFMDQWKHLSSHDSAYRSELSGIIHELMMQAAEVCYGHVPQEHRPKSVCGEVDAWIETEGVLYKFARIEHRAADRLCGYKRILTKLRPYEGVEHNYPEEKKENHV